MTLINVLEVTEKELIELTMEWGYGGEEFKSKAWLDRNCLKPNDGTHKKLISKAETRFNNVSFAGRGNKRIYFLSDLKETPSKREFNYVGTVESHDESEMKEFMFNKLLEAKGTSGFHLENGSSYNGWANYFGFFSSKGNLLAEEQLINVLNDFHGKPKEKDYYKPFEIVENFNDAIYDTRRATVKNAFNRLKQEGRISIEEVPMEGSRSADDKRVIDYSVTSLEKYEEMKVAKEKLILDMESTLAEYNRNINKKNKPKRIRDIFEAVDRMLEKEFGVVRFHLSYKVSILNPEMESNTSFTDLNYHFFNRLTKLVRDRKNKADYKTSTYFWRRFYLLNMLLIQKEVFKPFNFADLLAEEKKSYSQELNNYYEDCKRLEVNASDEERTVYGFGEVKLESKKKEIPAALKDVDIDKLFDEIKPQEVKKVKEIKPAGWIDIAAIPTEDEPEVVVEKKDGRSFGDIVDELDKARKEKGAKKLDSSLLPKSSEAKFKFTGYNITELSLRGFGS